MEYDAWGKGRRRIILEKDWSLERKRLSSQVIDFSQRRSEKEKRKMKSGEIERIAEASWPQKF
jgi:hypothetical protein